MKHLNLAAFTHVIELGVLQRRTIGIPASDSAIGRHVGGIRLSGCQIAQLNKARGARCRAAKVVFNQGKRMLAGRHEEHRQQEQKPFYPAWAKRLDYRVIHRSYLEVLLALPAWHRNGCAVVRCPFLKGHRYSDPKPWSTTADR